MDASVLSQLPKSVTVSAFGVQDPVSAATHFVAFLAALYILPVFWRLGRGDRARRLVLMCFGASLVLLFGASTTYHALMLPTPQRLVLQMIDHSAIYLLIAGTYTPTLWILLPEPRLRGASLAVIWSMALGGIASKWLLVEPAYWLVVAPYILLGWIGVLLFPSLRRAVHMQGLKWVIAGGLAYSLGAVMDWRQWPDLFHTVVGPHEVFHLCAMLGAFCHVVFVVKYVAPYGRRPAEAGALAAVEALPAAEVG